MKGSLWLCVALGGSLGALLRYAVSLWLSRGGFPWGTLIVNAVGSLALGWVAGWSERGLSEAARAFVGVGLLGAMTTFSTFSVDTLQLWRQSSGTALVYVLAQVVCGVSLAWCGYEWGRR